MEAMRKTIVATFCVACMVALPVFAGKTVRPCRLQCEHLVSPIGVDTDDVRLSWSLGSSKEPQTVVVGKDSAALVRYKTGQGAGEVDVYRLDGDARMLRLSDRPLCPSTTYWWMVMAGTGVSDIASFTTTMPLAQAKWISDGNDSGHKPLAVYSRTVNVRREISKVFMVVASAGLHEVRINGMRQGDERLNPMFTRFDRRLLSVMYDVTSAFRNGDNVVEVELGNGWFNMQSTAVWLFHEASWRDRPRFAARLQIRYSDGTCEEVVTDGEWATRESPTVFSSIYTAEHYDATHGKGETGMGHAVVVDCPTLAVSPQKVCPIRCTATWNAVRMDKLSDTLFVYHFPKNMAGVSRLRTKGEAGTTVRMKHGEMLYDDGRVNTGNIDYHYRPQDDSDPFQTDIVVLGDDSVDFAPRFNYKGFQYVEVSTSRPVGLCRASVVAEEMHSDVPQTAWWHSSSRYLNSLLAAANNSYLSNLFGYPTDCPQREKNGWTADAFLALETGLSTYDAISVYEKWMQDFRDEQKPDGTLPCIIPTDKWGYDWANGVDWTSATILIPWQLYVYYGDTTVLRHHYKSMKAYMTMVGKKAKDNLVDWGLGDWIPVKSKSDLTFTTSVYYYADAVVMSKIARTLGNTADEAAYGKLAVDIRNAINGRFLDTRNAIYAGGTQTELAMALYWGIVPVDLVVRVAENLNSKVVANGYHLDVGVHGCKTLLKALTDNGYATTAYRVVCQDSYPSWGYWIRQGATTLHENWKTDVVVDNSLNHIMFGEVGSWLYYGLAGVSPQEQYPGYRHVNIKPLFPDDLESLYFSRNTLYGTLTAEWHRTSKGIVYTVDVPKAMTVHLTLPDGTAVDLKSGKKNRIRIE